MSDPSTSGPAEDANAELKSELSRSLNSIWSRHNGGKPSSCDTELKADSVKFVMHDAVSGIGADPDEPENGEEPGSPDSIDYRNEAIAAVRRITKRNVRGFIPKRNKKTDEASDTYILEQVHRPQ